MLGLRIKQLREELNLNQEELAKKLNISPSTIGMYETNRRQPNYEILENLSNIFNCSIDYLLGKSDIRNPEEIKIDADKINIGLSAKDYENITDNQRKQIEEFAKLVLKDNLKNKDNK